MPAGRPSAKARLAQAGRGDGWILIAGQMKAATTSLHAMLSEHPEIQGTWPKETDWWSGARLDDRAFRRRFARGDGIVLDGSVDATRAKTDVTSVLAGSALRTPPAHIVYVVREERSRIRSQTIHAWYHERFPRTAAAARDCLDEALRTSDIEARLGPLVQAWPEAQVHLVHFDAFVTDPVATAKALGEAIGLDEWTPRPHHEFDKDTQQPLAGPLRVLPGRDRAVRLGKRLLGTRSAWLRRVVGGRTGVPSRHPLVESMLDEAQGQVDDVRARNEVYLERLVQAGARWVA